MKNRIGTKRFKGPTDQQRKLAEGVIKYGNTFKNAALAAGYSPKVAKLGAAYMRRHSVGVDVAFIEQAKQLTWEPEEVKAIIRSRLLADITSGKSSGLGRECELLGKDKDVDMFVRNADMQVGIFANLLEPRNAEMIENLAATIEPEEKVLCNGIAKPAEENDTGIPT
jgi:hypothetical protein